MSNPYPNIEQQPTQIDDSVAAQASLISDPTLSQANDDQKNDLFKRLCSTLILQIVFIFILSIIFDFLVPFGIVTSFIFFTSFLMTVHIFMFTHKSRGILKDNQVNKLNFVLYFIGSSIYIAMLSSYITYYIGELFASPYITALITNFWLLIMSYIFRNRLISIKQFTIQFATVAFFVNLITSLFNGGFLYFGIIIGQLVGYAFGCYLVYIRQEIFFPINDIEQQQQQQVDQQNVQTDFQQIVQLVISFIGLGNLPQESPITLQVYLAEKKELKYIIKLLFTIGAFGTIMLIFPIFYFPLLGLSLYFVYGADTRLIQVGKKEEVRIHEMPVVGILTTLDMIGGLRYII